MYSTLKKASVEVVADFVLHCLHKLLEEQSRGSPTIGYRMFIQLVLTSQPQAVVNHLDTVCQLDKLSYIDLYSPPEHRNQSQYKSMRTIIKKQSNTKRLKKKR